MTLRPVRPYRKRLIEPLLEQMLLEHPAILLVGPRACGKTTTAMRFARSVVRLDRPRDAAAFRADPDVALTGLAEPILLDGQVLPEVLGAVKRAVDIDPRPGRFWVTGSVRGDLEGDMWPGTGRLVRLAIHPMAVGERQERPMRPPGTIDGRWRRGIAQGGAGPSGVLGTGAAGPGAERPFWVCWPMPDVVAAGVSCRSPGRSDAVGEGPARDDR